MSQHMSGGVGRSASVRRSSALAAMTIAVVVGACSSAGAPTGSSGPAPSAAPAASASPSAAATSKPSASPATFVRPEASPIPKTALEPALEKLWSSKIPGQPWIWAPTVDPKGRIWAASSFEDSFLIVDADGKYLETWTGAGAGKGDGQFNLDAEGNGYGDVTFKPDGSFYVADSGNARVQLFDADRTFQASFGQFGTHPGEFILPIDIDIDRAGNVYVYDGGRLDVQVFSPDGTFQRIAATHVGPYEAVDEAGNVYAVDNDPIVLYRFTPAGKIDLAVDLKALVPFATGIDVTPAGDVLIGVSDTGGAAPTYLSLIQLGPDGVLKHAWPNGAEAVAVDPSGERVYLTYSDRNPEITAYALPAD